MAPLKNVRRATLGACALAIALAGCEREAVEVPQALPRPVTVSALKVSDPTRRLLLTAAVVSWKRENVGFEVSGRVKWVIERGEEARLPSELGGKAQGDILAELDRTRYGLRVESAQAEKAAAEAKAKALRAEIDEVLRQELNAAVVDRDRAKTERDRVKTLVDKGVESGVTMDRYEAAHAVAEAQVRKIEAAQRAKLAGWEAVLAQINQAAKAIEAAKTDEAACTLRAPFTGRVADVHVIPGAFVQPGQPVVTLIVMDPLKVEAAVSPETERTLRRGDTVRVYPPGLDQPQEGLVFHKETVADPATRTFKVTILVQNRRVAVGLPKDEKLHHLPRVSELWPVLNGDPPWLGVEARTLHPEAGGHWVWQVERDSARAAGGDAGSALRLRRVHVTLGERRRKLLGLYEFCELGDPGGLREHDVLAASVPPGVKDGDRVLFVRDRWLFRPGDVARVLLHDSGTGPGLYLPMDAIIPKAGSHSIFVVEENQVGEQFARQVRVRLTGGVGDLRRVEGEEIASGTPVILDGAHFLVDGEPVKVVEKRVEVQ